MTDYTLNPAGLPTRTKVQRHDGPFDCGHHILLDQRQHVSDIQNVEKLSIEVSDDSDSDLDAPPVSLFTDSAFQWPQDAALILIRTPKRPSGLKHKLSQMGSRAFGVDSRICGWGMGYHRRLSLSSASLQVE